MLHRGWGTSEMTEKDQPGRERDQEPGQYDVMIAKEREFSKKEAPSHVSDALRGQ